MSNKQSSVDWLVVELNQELNYIPIRQWDRIKDLIQRAKEMHKQEIIDAYHTNPLEAKWQNKGFQYYNEIYGGNNEQ